MHIHTTLSRTVGALMLCSACHDDGLGEHGCPLDYSNGWGSYGLNVEHEEPTRCPVFITEPGAARETGATIIDGGVRNFTDNRLLLVDANGSPITVKNTVFGYDESGRWVSAAYVFYAAGRASLRPDDAYFDLTFNGGAAGPTAHMSISYTDAVSASINGPGSCSNPVRTPGPHPSPRACRRIRTAGTETGRWRRRVPPIPREQGETRSSFGSTSVTHAAR